MEPDERKSLRRCMARLRPALGPSAAVVLALVPAAVGITWGLPSEERFARVVGGDAARREEIAREVVRRTREDAARKAGRLTIPMLDPGEPDTPARLYRRFALYSDHPDEMLVLAALSRMRPSRLELDPGTYRYGGLFFYPLGATLALARLVGLAELSRGPATYLEDPGRFGRLYLLGRLYCLAWHAAGLAALLLLAREMFGARASYLAVAVYALMPATVAFSHVMKPHVPGVAPLLLAVLVLRRARSVRGYALAGGLVGLAASLLPMYALGIFLLPAFAVERRGVRLSWRPVLVGVAAAAAVFALLNPFVVLRPGNVLREMAYLAGTLSMGPTWLAPVAFVRYLPDALTWPGFAAVLAAIVWLVREQREDARTMLIPLAAVFVVVSIVTARSAAGPVTARFGCMLFPFLALFTAGAAERLLARRGRCRIVGAAAATALVLSLAVGSAPYVAAYAANAWGRGTRLEAGRHIGSRVPAGSAVGVFGRLAPFRTPTAEIGRVPPDGRYRWVDLDLDPAARPEWFLTVERERPPEGYALDRRIAPFGTWPPFGSPERMSYASPAFFLWRRER